MSEAGPTYNFVCYHQTQVLIVIEIFGWVGRSGDLSRWPRWTPSIKSKNDNNWPFLGTKVKMNKIKKLRVVFIYIFVNIQNHYLRLPKKFQKAEEIVYIEI